MAELSLLLDRGRLGVALRDDNAAQWIAEFAGNLLICRFAAVIAEADLRLRLARRQKDAPSVIRHLHVVVMRPSVRLDADGRAQINVFLLKSGGPHLAPPVEVIRQ